MRVFIGFVILLAVPIVGCATSYDKPSVTAQSAKTGLTAANAQQTSKVQLAKLHGLEAKGKTLKLQVMSNGCTNTKSFKLMWQDEHLTVQRLKADYCRRMPHKIWLKFEIPTHVKEFSMANKFAR